MNSFIPWVGGKGKLLWIINKLMPDRYTRFIDVFGGSGTVTMCRPFQRGCMEVYNDFNGNLTNLFCCVKNRPMALLAELGFLPLNTRDDFNVLYKFFSKGEFTDDYLQEERAGAVIYCDPPYYKAESCYEVEFPPEDHQRLHDVLVTCEGYFIVSYNYQDYICEIYQDCYIFRTSRPNSMSQTAGSEYEEIVITNYDPRKACWQLSMDSLLGGDGDTRYELIHEPEHPLKI